MTKKEHERRILIENYIIFSCHECKAWCTFSERIATKYGALYVHNTFDEDEDWFEEDAMNEYGDWWCPDCGGENRIEQEI